MVSILILLDYQFYLAAAGKDILATYSFNPYSTGLSILSNTLNKHLYALDDGFNPYSTGLSILST